MFFTRFRTILPEGVTVVRLRAAKGKITRWRKQALARNDAIALFPWLQEPVPEYDPAEEIAKQDARLVQTQIDHRAEEAAKWRKARRELRALPDKDRQRVLAHWNLRIYPGDAGWFYSIMKAILSGAIDVESYHISLQCARIRGQCKVLRAKLDGALKDLARKRITPPG